MEINVEHDDQLTRTKDHLEKMIDRMGVDSLLSLIETICRKGRAYRS